MTLPASDHLHALYDRFPGVGIGGGADAALHLFHAPNSICSQKVRAVLAFHGLDHWSHQLDIFSGETYDPAYVRVRHAGCVSAGLPLADRHLGTTSVASGGCDACVVPTLVDGANGEVIVDSLRICRDIDDRLPEDRRLVPASLEAGILAELAIVDELPNYQNLATRVIPDSAPLNAFALSKVRRCNDLLDEHGDDPVLRASYEAKRSKEQTAADRLFDSTALAQARQAVADALQGLESRLNASGGPWLFGDRVTMADLFWGAELIRAEDVAQAGFWSDGRLPHVEAWYERLKALPALKVAIMDYPGARLAGKPAANA